LFFLPIDVLNGHEDEDRDEDYDRPDDQPRRDHHPKAFLSVSLAVHAVPFAGRGDRFPFFPLMEGKTHGVEGKTRPCSGPGSLL
jgi:hypothetical protein